MLKSLFDYIKMYVKRKDILITSLQDVIKILDGKLKVQMNTIDALEDAHKANILLIEDLKDKLSKLKAEINKDIPQNVIYKCIDLRNAYPKATITYAGYGIKLKNSIVKPNVDIRDFIYVLESHRKWCLLNGLTLAQYKYKNEEMEFGELVNSLQFEIYKKYIARKTYQYDSTLYGIDEHWSPLIDSWYLKKMDCENSSFELMALFEAAGLTGVLKNLTWNVCGMAKLGGHSTVYCYDLKNNVWRHLETTTTYTNINSFYQLPLNTDETDKANIYNVWFSFNSETARHTFKTVSAEKDFKARNRFNNITIK